MRPHLPTQHTNALEDSPRPSGRRRGSGRTMSSTSQPALQNLTRAPLRHKRVTARAPRPRMRESNLLYCLRPVRSMELANRSCQGCGDSRRISVRSAHLHRFGNRPAGDGRPSVDRSSAVPRPADLSHCREFGAGETSGYRGIAEFEHLATRIGEMMRSLRAKTLQLETILQSMSDAITVYDADLRCRYGTAVRKALITIPNPCCGKARPSRTSCATPSIAAILARSIPTSG